MGKRNKAGCNTLQKVPEYLLKADSGQPEQQVLNLPRLAMIRFEVKLVQVRRSGGPMGGCIVNTRQLPRDRYSRGPR